MQRLLITGAGSLAIALAQALPAAIRARSAGPGVRVFIASRSMERGSWAVAVARAAAASVGCPMTFEARPLSWSPTELDALIDDCRPDVIVHTASYQSAWSLAKPTPWSRLVRASGYGFTLPLQAALTLMIADANRRAARPAALVNACYPDLTNAVCSALGRTILCGIGNIALVAETVRQGLDVDRGRLRVLAGHWDVEMAMRAPEDRPAFPRAWVDDVEIDPAAIWTHAPRLSADDSLNLMNAAVSCEFLSALLLGQDMDVVHLPGVNGASGGEPAVLRAGRLIRSLPAGLSEMDLVIFQQMRALADGAFMESGEVVLSPRAASAVNAAGVGLRTRYPLSDVPAEAEGLLDLRRFLTRD